MNLVVNLILKHFKQENQKCVNSGTHQNVY